MGFDWNKFYDVGIFLLDYSDKEEYQRSGIGRLYYACFGESRLYYEKAFLSVLPSKDSHSILIATLENSIYEEEQELGEYLHKLRNSRNRADYGVKLKRYDVNNSRNNAKLILKLLDEFYRNPVRPI
ncbi:hypothetical protein MBORA_15740 [Methanobrevibacter oralis]|uniref:HEPN domain protein n=1 Tax=Methanobrevibacter oralis TaxID=66851 RepID=A0A165ZYG4_METOA|nr:hypothetical protein [Methanobrevibacter oralis]KZX11329.1 hypothetical protein MBORA_15740 [Methanobrevibacter oralis]